MIPDLRHLPPGFSPRQFVAACIGTVLKNWDVVIMIDGDDANVLGPLGQAKTRVGLWLSHAIASGLGIEFDLGRDLVVQDDLGHAYSLFPEYCDECDPDKDEICETHALALQVIMWDEAHWFLYNEWHSFREVRALTPIFMSNRKRRVQVGEGDDAFGATVWILSTNLIWKVLEFFRESRVQVRIRMESRAGAGADFAVADVFLRAGSLSNNPKTDSWGGLAASGDGAKARRRPNSRWTRIPRLPSPLWDGYMLRYEDHVHEDEVCVSRLRVRS